MRTTIDINDELLRQAKTRAAHEDSTLKEILDSALRLYLTAEATHTQPFKLQWKTHKGGSIQPGVVLEDRDALFDLMEGRR